MAGGVQRDDLDLVKLTKLMELTRGQSNIKVGLVDGPVSINHPYLNSKNITVLSTINGVCTNPSSVACTHGTFIAGILLGQRNSQSPSICCDCTMITYPIFSEQEQMPSATPNELAEAIVKCIDSGIQILNLSIGLTNVSKNEKKLSEALDYAAENGVVTIAAAGNQKEIGGSVITNHPWVIPVVACDEKGNPMNQSNLGASIGRHGLMAPGEKVRSLAAGGGFTTLGGTSIAAPFVSGTVALLLSQFPDATAVELKLALVQGLESRRKIVPPLLNAWNAYQFMSTFY